MKIWSNNERGWTAPVSETGDDGAAAGNITRDEHQVIKIGGGRAQRVRKVAINGRHRSFGPWAEEPLGGGGVQINWAATLAAWRRRCKLSQAGATAALGLKLRTLQEWEQGRRRPQELTREAVLARMETLGPDVPGRPRQRRRGPA